MCSLMSVLIRRIFSMCSRKVRSDSGAASIMENLVISNRSRSVSPITHRIPAPKPIHPLPVEQDKLPVPPRPLAIKHPKKPRNLIKKHRKAKLFKIKTQGKTYFGNYFKKLAKRIGNKIPMSDESKYVFDDVVYSLFSRIMQQATQVNMDTSQPGRLKPRKGKKGKAKVSKKSVLSKRDIQCAVGLLVGRNMFTRIQDHYIRNQGHLDFVLQSEGEQMTEDVIDPVAEAAISIPISS